MLSSSLSLTREERPTVLSCPHLVLMCCGWRPPVPGVQPVADGILGRVRQVHRPRRLRWAERGQALARAWSGPPGLEFALGRARSGAVQGMFRCWAGRSEGCPGPQGVQSLLPVLALLQPACCALLRNTECAAASSWLPTDALCPLGGHKAAGHAKRAQLPAWGLGARPDTAGAAGPLGQRPAPGGTGNAPPAATPAGALRHALPRLACHARCRMLRLLRRAARWPAGQGWGAPLARQPQTGPALLQGLRPSAASGSNDGGCVACTVPCFLEPAPCSTGPALLLLQRAMRRQPAPSLRTCACACNLHRRLLSTILHPRP